MKYEKPEVVVFGSAVETIRGCEKGIMKADSNPSCPDTLHTVVAAYEADE
jgi:hypothetical protein